MSITSIHTFGIPQAPRAQAGHAPKRLASVPAGNSARADGRVKILHFGSRALAGNGRNTLWVTVECPPVGGGVSGVTKFAPAAMAKHTNEDFRIITPYLAPMAREDAQLKAQNKDKMAFKKPDGAEVFYPLAFEETGAEIKLPVYDRGQKIEEGFRLLQKFQPVLSNGQMNPRADNPDIPEGNWVYGVYSDKYFTPFETPYSYNNKKVPEGLTDDIDPDPSRAMKKINFNFARAAAAFAPLLESAEKGQSANAHSSGVQKFNGPIDIIKAHDWPVGLIWRSLPKDDKSGHNFVLHNSYDAYADEAMLDELDIPVPEYAAVKHPITQKPIEKIGAHSGKPRLVPLGHTLSALMVGIKEAHNVDGCNNYVRDIVWTDLNKGEPLVEPLKEKFEQGLVYDLHHGLPGQDFNPAVNPHLNPAKGFALLKALTPEDVKAFKRTNKLATQKMLGLKEGDDYVLYTSMGRVDPYQKGSYLLLNEAEKFLKTPGHEKAQMIIAFSDSNPKVAQWAEKIQQDPDLSGRLWVSHNQFLPREVNVPFYAGSDFFLMPSVYEPFGQTQLEAYSMGAIPIGHGVHGIRSTVSDPELQKDGASQPEKVWEYGQTGILMKPFDSAAYKEALAFDEQLESAQEKLKTGKWNLLQMGDLQAILTYLFNKVMTHLFGEQHQPLPFEQTLNSAQNSFREALDRSYEMAKDPDALNRIRLNGMKYFQTEHADAKIALKYVASNEQAIDARDHRLPGGRLSSFA
jgi:hypothetical protein